MNLKLKIKIKKVAFITIVWILVGVWITIYDHFALQSGYSEGSSESYRFSTSLIFNIMAGLIGSLLGGTFLVFFINEKYRDRSYGFTIAAVLITFLLIVAFITIVLTAVFIPILTGHALFSPEGLDAYWSFIQNPLHLKNVILWSVVVALTQLFLQVDNKFGDGILFDFIKGKYRRPRQEQRVFMFVDLKSSTTIAEQLGDLKYHEFLKEFFSDITNAIIYNRGQIYQYVGDEVVVSWTMENALENNQCVQCYFDMKSSIEKKGAQYLEKYERAPEFKAGIHFGNVIAGEIGIIKRDITYSGNVLNTTARIQSMCNGLEVALLLSRSLADLLEKTSRYTVRSLGQINLRGKQDSMELCTLDR